MECECDDGPQGGDDSGQTQEDILLDALRSSTLDPLNILSFKVIHSFSMDELTDEDEQVHILTDVREPSGRYRDGLLMTSGGHVTTLLLAGSDGKIGQGRIFSEDGKVSDVGPRTGWSTRDEWAELAIKIAVHLSMRRSESRSPGFETDRVRAHEHLPLLEFKARTSCPIRLRSWRLADTTAVPGAEGARVELWTGVLADGLITYSAIAAGHRADGTIAALACTEGMPSEHNLAFLGMFTPHGTHQNLGPTVPGGDFLATAVPLLTPCLTESQTEADSRKSNVLR